MRCIRRKDRVVVALALVGLLAGAPAVAAPVAPTVADWGWLFDEGVGTTAGAAAGGEDGTLLGGAGWSADTPFAYAGNHSLLLDGAGDAVEVDALNSALNGASAFSLSLWVRSDAVNQDRAFFSGADPSNSDTIGGRYDNAGWLNGNSGTRDLLKFGLMIDGTNYQYESAGGYQTTSWQHVAFVWESGSGAQLWVDGVLDTPSETSSGFDGVSGVLSDQTRFLIGDGPKNPWQGRIDEVMVWRSALTADNVEYLAGSSSAPSAIPVPEPSTAWMLAIGLVGLFGLSRASRPRR